MLIVLLWRRKGRPRPPTGRSEGDVVVLDVVVTICGCTAGLYDGGHPVDDQIDRVVTLAVALVAVLADATGDADQVALADLRGPFVHLAEAGNAVPVGVVLPAVAVLAGIVGCDIEVSDLISGVDFADAADDVKVCTILHDVSPWVVSLLTHFEAAAVRRGQARSEEHTSELQSLMRISY